MMLTPSARSARARVKPRRYANIIRQSCEDVKIRPLLFPYDLSAPAPNSNHSARAALAASEETHSVEPLGSLISARSAAINLLFGNCRIVVR